MTETTYALKGVANKSTIAQNPKNGHIGTNIQIIKYIDDTKISDSLIDGPQSASYFSETKVTLANGATARITQARNGYGAVRVEWVYRGNSYLLISAHVRTHHHGVSGVPTRDLVKIAGSITS